MRSLLGILLVSFALPALVTAQDNITKSDKLEKNWELEGLDVPESVLVLPEQGIMYVSNIGAQDPTTQEGAGFISILGTDGRIKNLKWVDGLDSPKGMAISGDKLYVTEVDRIAAIEISSGKKVKEYPVEGAKFLNDIAADAQGNLYITDSRKGIVHKLSDGKLSTFVQSDDYPNVNGVLVAENYLYLGTGDKIVKINLETKETNDYLTGTGAVDGIAFVGPETMLFSDWPGKVHLMEKGKEKELIYDTSKTEKTKTADFGYDSEKKIIYIPTFFANTIVSFKLTP